MHPSTQSLPQVITCKLPGASKPLPPQPKLEVSFSQSDGEYEFRVFKIGLEYVQSDQPID